MSKKIKIKVEGESFIGRLNESNTSKKLWEILPVKSKVSTWGDEIYFDIPLNTELGEDAKEEVDVGTLAYWPPGSAFCIFFGKTPASTNDKPRAASAVEILGKLDLDVERLKKISPGSEIVVDVVDKEE